jgi:antitoxin VapB
MAILIKNPEVEKRARELAALTGESLTVAIDVAVRQRLAQTPRLTRKAATLEEMIAATDEFRRAVGLDRQPLTDTKALIDAINEIPGLEDDT